MYSSILPHFWTHGTARIYSYTRAKIPLFMVTCVWLGKWRACTLFLLDQKRTAFSSVEMWKKWREWNVVKNQWNVWNILTNRKQMLFVFSWTEEDYHYFCLLLGWISLGNRFIWSLIRKKLLFLFVRIKVSSFFLRGREEKQRGKKCRVSVGFFSRVSFSLLICRWNIFH